MQYRQMVCFMASVCANRVDYGFVDGVYVTFIISYYTFHIVISVLMFTAICVYVQYWIKDVPWMKQMLLSFRTIDLGLHFMLDRVFRVLVIYKKLKNLKKK